MGKLIVIGIDSMDRELILKFKDFLPNIRKFAPQDNSINLKGVFPPDSPTSWASIYTGLNPAEHGIIHFIDPLERMANLVNKEINQKEIVGKTFFDILDSEGFKTASLFGLLTYPPWKLKNGTIISRPTTNKGEIVALPKKYKRILDERLNYKPTHLYEAKNPPEFLKAINNLLNNEFIAAKKLILEESWDLVFFFTSVLDTIQHDFWGHFDDRDPDFDSNSPFINVIRDFYIRVDEEIGKVVKEFSDYTIIVLSDHGHNIRPIRIVNINEFLRREGLLIASDNFLIRLIEKIKNSTRKIIFKFNLAKYALKVLRIFPRAKNIYTKPISLNKEETLVSLSDLSGVKSYPYGGITINKKNLDAKEYANVRDSVFASLKTLIDPKTGKNCFKWIKKREELYNGEYVEDYPDILFLMEELLGTGWSFGKNVPLFDNIDSHSISPGCHDGNTPVFLISHPKLETPFLRGRTSLDLMDIKNIIIEIVRSQ